MKITLSDSIKDYPDFTLVPVAQAENTPQVLSLVSATTNIPVEVIEADFPAGLKDVHTLYFSEAGKSKRIILLGLGKAPGINEISAAFRSFIFRRKANLNGSLAISFVHKNAGAPISTWVDAAVAGVHLGCYDIGLYKTAKTEDSKQPIPLENLGIFAPSEHLGVVKKAIQEGKATAETQLEIFNLVNAPSNKKDPKTLADWAIKSGEKYGYAVKVFDKKGIEKLGLHALLAVNRGSENPPTFIVMEYKPKGKAIKKVGLVGKGVTFDTGGLSIKPSTNMHYMKSDMGGAAAVLGTMEVAAKLNLPVHLVGVVPSTDNSVDSKSVKPGDVIGSYDGKTIEVIDTDAEGRLVLADGLAYLSRNYNPDILLDLATLTGSCIRTLGTAAGGLFSNNDDLALKLLEAGQSTGERLWQLPLWDDYKSDIKSDVADVKNFSGKPMAGAISAAKFLEVFTGDHSAWAHMDIAGMALGDSEYSIQKSATAFGIRLLIGFLQGLD